MDEEEKIVSLQDWKRNRDEENSEEEFDKDQLHNLPIIIASAYWHGILVGKREKWMELRWHMASLLFSNLVSIAVIWWLLSRH